MTVIVRELGTGKTIHRGWYQRLHQVWEPTARTVADWYECEPDDVSIEETDDGDRVTVQGKQVASIETKWDSQA